MPSVILDRYGRAFEVPAPHEQVRGDRWVNQRTGIGSWRDKTMAGHFETELRLWDPEIVNLYNGSDLAAKAIEHRPFEMFRRGYELKSDKVDDSEIQDFREWVDETFDLDKKLRNGRKWGGAFGGLLLILGIDDGRDPWEPVDETRIRSINYINPVDRRFAFAQSYYADLDAPKYGEPEIYLVSNGVASGGQLARGKASVNELQKGGFRIGLVHESRCIRFDGHAADITTQQLLAGWSWSVLQRPYQVLRSFDHAFDSATYLLTDAGQGVFKLQGLIKAVSAGQQQAFEDRIRFLEDTRSVMNGIAVDAGDKDGKNAEDFVRQPTPFAGIPDMLDRQMQRVSAAFSMPVIKLFGAGAGGLNAAGEAEATTRDHYDEISSEQETELAPPLKRVYRLISLAKNSPLKSRKSRDIRWSITFNPLWSQTDKELADTRLANAQRDHIYMEDGAVPPEVVGATLKDIYPKLDVESLEDAIEGGKKFDPYENEPEPEIPAGNAGAAAAGGQSPSSVLPLQPQAAQGARVAVPKVAPKKKTGSSRTDAKPTQAQMDAAYDERARLAKDASAEASGGERSHGEAAAAHYSARAFARKAGNDDAVAIHTDKIKEHEKAERKAATRP